MVDKEWQLVTSVDSGPGVALSLIRYLYPDPGRCKGVMIINTITASSGHFAEASNVQNPITCGRIGRAHWLSHKYMGRLFRSKTRLGVVLD